MIRKVVVAVAALVAVAVAAPGQTGPPSCSKCGDLFKFMQKVKDLELIRDAYRRYIPGEPDFKGPVRTVEDVEAFVRSDICAAVGGCGGGGGGTSLRAELYTTVPDCVIRFNGDPLTPDKEREYRKVQCRPFADAAIAHERVHKANCEFTNKGGWTHDFDDPAMHAADEVDAYNLSIKMVRESMRKLAKNCGWQPTARQRKDPSAIPSDKQLEDMRARAWRAAKAVGGGKK